MNKKTKIVIVALLLLMASAAQAQIFLQEGDENNMRDVTPTTPVNAWPENPPYNQGVDNYTPLGCGIMVLTVLGGAYLIGKRKKDRSAGHVSI